MLKPITFSVITIAIAYLVYTQSNSDFEFEKFKSASDYKAQEKLSDKKLKPLVVKKIKSPRIVSAPPVESQPQQIEFISDDKAIKSCNLILKSKLSLFKRLDAFLSSPCKEVAGQKISENTKRQRSSLNWLRFYQEANTNLEEINFKQKEQLKKKLIVQLSNPGNLIQASILSDILINIMNKHEAVKAQEIEKLNNAMATEVEYLTNAASNLNENDPQFKSLVNQEIQAVQRYQSEFRNIMDIE